MLKSVLLVISLLSATAFAADMKIGLVDMQKAIQSTAAGKKAKTELEGEFEKRKKELQKKEADLKKMNDDLEKKRAVMSDEVLGRKQAELQEEMLKYRETLTKNQNEIQKKERDLTQPILEKMKKTIQEVAKEGGYSYVIENSPMVLFADPAHDLTDKVIKAFEKTK
ncbi:MAG: OmpH family outer membrane protein [Bdellovibrionales bacterium]